MKADLALRIALEEYKAKRLYEEGATISVKTIADEVDDIVLEKEVEWGTADEVSDWSSYDGESPGRHFGPD